MPSSTPTSANRSRPATGWLVAVVQAAVTLIAIAGLVLLIDWSEAIAGLGRVSPQAMLAAIGLAAFSQGLGAWRLSLILRDCGVGIGLRRSLEFTWIGLFAGNFLPATIGGDALFAVLMKRSGFPMGPGLIGLLYNRLVNVLLVLACVPVALALPELHWSAALPDGGSGLFRWLGWLVLAGLGLAILGLALSRHGPVARRLAASRIELRLPGLRGRPGLGLKALVLSMAMLGLGAWALLELARGMRPDFSYPAMWAVLVITLAAQILPLSINGIGVQETVFTVSLVQACGWTPADALGFSLLARLLGIAISLPGLSTTIRLLNLRKTPPAENRDPAIGSGPDT